MSDNYPINSHTLMASEICGELGALYRSRLDHYEDANALDLARRLMSDLEAAGWALDGLPVTRWPGEGSRGLTEALEAYAARYAEEANASHARPEEPESVRLAQAHPIEHDPRRESMGEEVAALAATVSAPGLRPMDSRIIAALVTCPTKAEAARVAGVSRSTLYERMRDPVFSDAYEAARLECVAGAMADSREALALGASEAVEALRAIVSDPFASGSDRVRAATEILRAYFLTERTDNDNR